MHICKFCSLHHILNNVKSRGLTSCKYMSIFIISYTRVDDSFCHWIISKHQLSFACFSFRIHDIYASNELEIVYHTRKRYKNSLFRNVELLNGHQRATYSNKYFILSLRVCILTNFEYE